MHMTGVLGIKHTYDTLKNGAEASPKQKAVSQQTVSMPQWTSHYFFHL